MLWLMQPNKLLEEQHMYEIEILLIDDKPADIELTRETFNENKLRNNLNIVSNGSDANAFLRHDFYVPQPDLIMLDSEFSRSTDQSIFNAIKQDEHLRYVPLVIMTPAGREPDMPLHITPPNGFVTKPLDFLQFIHVIKSIKSFRVAIVTSLL